LAKIKINPDTEMFFNEWLMMDFSMNGYDSVPAGKKIFSVFFSEATLQNCQKALGYFLKSQRLFSWFL